MGKPSFSETRIIFIENVRKAFVEPSDLEFKGFYESVKWLPTSASQDDPFHLLPKAPEELIKFRMTVTKVLMAATRDLNKDVFVYGSHDFSGAARSGMYFAFRQYISERYYHLSGQWAEIIDVYYKGLCPVGFVDDRLIVI
ncbi:hypothetical protein A244_01995 [Pseudomonas syringae pv. actinidiae ICMP 18807]|uniref:Uncharacterized protein n=1 Tax=Pseudomonas syringae pv. actinidiae ICMP 18807 TaxID=1194404 RepID=S6WIH5_PSESF|nr:hypothetical protein A244_01995 [Pseudomonas syringae pv. actinidiae ICMP 18807]